MPRIGYRRSVSVFDEIATVCELVGRTPGRSQQCLISPGTRAKVLIVRADGSIKAAVAVGGVPMAFFEARPDQVRLVVTDEAAAADAK